MPFCCLNLKQWKIATKYFISITLRIRSFWRLFKRWKPSSSSIKTSNKNLNKLPFIISLNMHNNSHLLLLLFFTFIHSQNTQTNTSFYINFVYETETTVEPFSSDYRFIKLPCTSRIYLCSYEFSLLPSGWKASEGGILVPIKDALTVGNYAVELTAS